MKGVTAKQMCEKIAELGILKRHDGTKPTAEEIFNYSQTGELSEVFLWYQAAIAYENFLKEEAK